ncbi:Permease family protein [Weissella hellenica]|uniref:Permease family protein n=1 Tax=Weissella hellenica TaxID=46256 RepID=A0ABY0K3F1_WEIHE|nr:hypothetical protein WHE01_16900 [Weissella hellenica]SCC14553.1 Permease family protein [Weissella hellenica]
MNEFDGSKVQPTGFLDKFFHVSAQKSTVKREMLAGVTTFVSMAYILFVNPSILGAAGMDKGAVFTATALAAVIGCVLMGVLANYPIAIAPGLGDNAFFAFRLFWEWEFLGKKQWLVCSWRRFCLQFCRF